MIEQLQLQIDRLRADTEALTARILRTEASAAEAVRAREDMSREAASSRRALDTANARAASADQLVAETRRQLQAAQERYEHDVAELEKKTIVAERFAVEGDADLIRWQRDARDKALALATAQRRQRLAEDEASALKAQLEQSNHALEEMREELRRERDRASAAERDARSSRSLTRRVEELEGLLRQADAEKTSLSQENRRLVQAALNDDRENEFRRVEMDLVEKVDRLRAQLKVELVEKQVSIPQCVCSCDGV
jgi:chromosome segregation ATPase